MVEIIVIAHNIRSTYNVGSLFRTCEGFGVSRLLLTGYSPFPSIAGDTRLPHIADKLTRQIHKTALGAEELVPFAHLDTPPFSELKRTGFKVIGLEQDVRSQRLQDFTPPKKIALLLGEEVNGIAPSFRELCDNLIEIPMKGRKESFNVSIAAGIALYGLTLIS